MQTKHDLRIKNHNRVKWLNQNLGINFKRTDVRAEGDHIRNKLISCINILRKATIHQKIIGRNLRNLAQ